MHSPFYHAGNGLPEKPLTGEDVDALPYMVLNSKKLKDATANIIVSDLESKY